MGLMVLIGSLCIVGRRLRIKVKGDYLVGIGERRAVAVLSCVNL